MSALLLCLFLIILVIERGVGRVKTTTLHSVEIYSLNISRLGTCLQLMCVTVLLGMKFSVTSKVVWFDVSRILLARTLFDELSMQLCVLHLACWVLSYAAGSVLHLFKLHSWRALVSHDMSIQRRDCLAIFVQFKSFRGQ